MKTKKFPENFIWGIASSDYQIEGSTDICGKGESIWDRFSAIPGRIKNGDSAGIACDHYRLFKDDINIMKELGVKSYRLSLSWPRIFPDGKGRLNEEGLKFYRELLEELARNDIKPMVTLNHWSLPQKLQDIGGWTNPDMPEYFKDYSETAFKAFGDIVPFWITHNEPVEICYLGYHTGENAPGIRDFSAGLLASKDMLIAHGLAVKSYRAGGYKGEIGITLDFHSGIPETDSDDDIKSAELVHLFFNRWFQDGVFKGQFPEKLAKDLKSKGVIVPEIEAAESEIMKEPIDFLGVNSYFPFYVSYDKSDWPLESKMKTFKKGRDTTGMGWDINPEDFFDTIMSVKELYGNIPVFITENGAAFNDTVERDGSVNDPGRIDYLYRHFEAARKCIDEGINLKGYYVWSLMDNFEWNSGFSQRFGLVHVDFASMKRTIKSSGYWYRDFIKNNSL